MSKMYATSVKRRVPPKNGCHFRILLTLSSILQVSYPAPVLCGKFSLAVLIDASAHEFALGTFRIRASSSSVATAWPFRLYSMALKSLAIVADREF
jgi:hypothetical protein